MDDIRPQQLRRREEDMSLTRRFIKGTQQTFLQYGALGAMCLVLLAGAGFQMKWTHDADVMRQQEQNALIRTQGAALDECRQQLGANAMQTLQVVANNTDALNSFKAELGEMKASVVNLGDRVTRVEKAVIPRGAPALDTDR